MKVYLASNSPRRRRLLGMIVPEFEIMEGADVDETYPANLSAEEVPLFLSRLKAKAYSPRLKADELLITADTVVILDGGIMGKPHDLDDARRMLRRLSGNTHKVITGFTITTVDSEGAVVSKSYSEETFVSFDTMSDDEINSYVETYRPLDKAGAYGIQEWTAAAVKGIKGCFYNVMGLPIHALYRALKADSNVRL